MENRVEFIDILKGIAIVIVVVFHHPYISHYPILVLCITGFYMQLFFILSGFFFGGNIKKRIKRLIIPYVSFYLLTYSVSFLSGVNNYLFSTPLLGADRNYYNTPIWFLLSLLECYCITWFLTRVCSFGNCCLFMCGVICCLFGLICSWYQYDIPYYIDTTLTNYIFYIFGFIFKDWIFKNISMMFLFVISFFYILLFAIFHPSVNTSLNYIDGNYLAFFVLAILGSMFFIILSGVLVKLCSFPLFNYWGKNSLIVLCIHIPLLDLSIRLLSNWISWGNISGGTLMIMIFVSVVFTLIMAFPIIYVVNKFFPFLLGKV